MGLESILNWSASAPEQHKTFFKFSEILLVFLNEVITVKQKIK